MSTVNLVVGIFGIFIGTAMLIVRFMKPEKLVKLVAMQEKYGPGYGYAVHLIFYSLAPIIFGIIMIFTAYQIPK